MFLQVMNTDYLISRKYTRGTNIVTHAGWNIQDLTSVIHIDQQHRRLYNMNYKPYC
jgi:hypothetical protein